MENSPEFDPEELLPWYKYTWEQLVEIKNYISGIVETSRCEALVNSLRCTLHRHHSGSHHACVDGIIVNWVNTKEL